MQHKFDMTTNRKIISFLVLIFVALLTSCTKDGDTIYIDDDEARLNDRRPIVYFIYAQGDMGDLGYIDELYRGVVKATNSGNMLLSCAELPSDATATDEALAYFLNYMQNMGSNRKALVVIANNNYETMLHGYEDVLRQNSNVDVLLVESNDTTLPVYSISFPQYGACYLAGCVTGRCLTDVNRVLVASANASSSMLADMRQGFADGLNSTSSGITVDNYYISSEPSGGYASADTVYNRSVDIDAAYQMVLPLCGGSVQGFLRYNREHPSSFYTVGIDTDMQAYSSRVPFSVVKHLSTAMEQWITSWANGKELDKHQTLGLEAGYTELVVADAYAERLIATAKQYLSIAINREKEHENK